jgi:hypothetical protein
VLLKIYYFVIKIHLYTKNKLCICNPLRHGWAGRGPIPNASAGDGKGRDGGKGTRGHRRGERDGSDGSGGTRRHRRGERHGSGGTRRYRKRERERGSPSVATVKTSTFEKCVITGAINYVKS